MATISSIGTSSRNYSTISSWLAAFAAGGWIGECYNDSQFTAGANFSGQATSATDFVELRTATGQSFRDNASVQTNPLRYDQAKGVGISQNTAYTDVFTVAEDYVTIKNLQIQNVSNGKTIENNGGYNNAVLDSCILESAGGNEGLKWRFGLMRNCLVIVRTANSVLGIECPYGSPTIVNCTIVRPSNFTAANTGISASSALVKNCAIFGFTTSISGAAAGSDYNCSDTTLLTGTHNQASKTYAGQFVTTTDTGRDFKTKAAADLLNNAVTDTTDVPSALDIVGTARPQSTAWDIGAWELVSGGGTSYTLVGAQGSFSETGKAAIPVFGRKLVCSQGSFSESGQAATLKCGRKLAAAQASFAFAGKTANLGLLYKLLAVQGAFAQTGKTASFKIAVKLSASCGSMVLTGGSVNFHGGGQAWTPVWPVTTAWIAAVADAAIWTPRPASSTNWTPQ